MSRLYPRYSQWYQSLNPRELRSVSKLDSPYHPNTPNVAHVSKSNNVLTSQTITNTNQKIICSAPLKGEG